MMNAAILGVGNMGKALVGGLKRAYGGDVRIAVWDKAPGALDGLGDDAAVEIIDPRGWKSAGFVPEALILAVKPVDICGLLDDTVIPAIREQGLDLLTISIAAGISISSIRQQIEGGCSCENEERATGGGRPYACVAPNGVRVCRVMPNTPAMIGEGMSAYALSDNCTAADARLVEHIFNACGKTVNIPENLMDAITGLSGSGPAFVYSFIEALVEGGVSAGLPYKTAMEAAVQTVIGAAKMVLATSESPSVLRSKVMSPGGTTVKGIEALERGAFKDTVMSAVIAAAKRSAELGKK